MATLFYFLCFALFCKTNMSSELAPLPLRVEFRLWDIERAQLLDEPTFWAAVDVAGEHCKLPPSVMELVSKARSQPRRFSAPLVSLEITVEQSIVLASTPQFAEPSSSVASPSFLSSGVNWQHSPVRFQFRSVKLREVLLLSTSPACMESSVTMRIFQWMPLARDGRDDDVNGGGASTSAPTRGDPRSASMCSVSERDDSEILSPEAAVRVCIGKSRVLLRALLNGDNLSRISFQLDKKLIAELLDPSGASVEVRDEVLGVPRGGVASATMLVTSFLVNCLKLPHHVRSGDTVGSDGAPRAFNEADGALSARTTSRSLSGGSHVSSSTSLSTIGLSKELMLMLLPLRGLVEAACLAVDLATWRHPAVTAAAYLIVFISVALDLQLVTAWLLLIVGSLSTVRSLNSIAVSTQLSSGPSRQHHSRMYLFPPRNVVVNTLLRFRMWMLAGFVEESTVECITLLHVMRRHVAAVLVALWSFGTALCFLAVGRVVLAGLAAVALALPVSLCALPCMPQLRRRDHTTKGSGLVQRLLGWELRTPHRLYTSALSVTCVVKALPLTAAALAHHAANKEPSLTEHATAMKSVSTVLDQEPGYEPLPSHRALSAPPPAAEVSTSPLSSGDSARANRGAPDTKARISPTTAALELPSVFTKKRSSMDAELRSDLSNSFLRSSDLPAAPPVSARAKRKETDTASLASARTSEPPETPRHRPQPLTVEELAVPGLTKRTSAMNLHSVHRRTLSQVQPAPAQFHFAVVTVDWKEDSMLTHQSLPPFPPPAGLSGRHSTVTDFVRQRLQQFYQKVEDAEIKLLGDGTPLDQFFSAQHTTSSAAHLVFDSIVSEAALLLVYLRRLWRSATVHISTSCLPSTDALLVERLERVAHPSSLLDHAPRDEVTSALLSGLAVMNVVHLPPCKSVDENCRAWALLAMSLLCGRRLSLFCPLVLPRTTFLIPLSQSGLFFDATKSCLGSCPPPLLQALQDVWVGFESGNGAGLPAVTMDIIINLISQRKEHWRQQHVLNSQHSAAGSSTTPKVAVPTVAVKRRESWMPSAVSPSRDADLHTPLHSAQLPTIKITAAKRHTITGGGDVFSTSSPPLAALQAKGDTASPMDAPRGHDGQPLLQEGSASSLHRHSRGVYETLGIARTRRESKVRAKDDYGVSSGRTGRPTPSPSHGGTQEADDTLELAEFPQFLRNSANF